MSYLCLKLIIYVRSITLVHSIFIFNHDQFIIDTPFVNIKNAVTSGNMKCGLDDEDLKVHQNKYNGTHIIFSYRQICDIRSKMDYAKKEDIYFNEFMQCNLKHAINTGHTAVDFFEFNDTCSIEYGKACQGEFMGPCIPTRDNSITSIITIVVDKQRRVFTTEEIQSRIGHDVICDPTSIHQENKTNKDSPYVLFRYGRNTCILKLHEVISHDSSDGIYALLTDIFEGVKVAPRFGQKVNEEPVKENEKFNKNSVRHQFSTQSPTNAQFFVLDNFPSATELSAISNKKYVTWYRMSPTISIIGKAVIHLNTEEIQCKIGNNVTYNSNRRHEELAKIRGAGNPYKIDYGSFTCVKKIDTVVGFGQVEVAGCNRTYYGEVGKTYDLELHRPKEDKIPFICHLTFNAGGGDFGDLIQLTFDSFTLGRFVSFTTDGCPDGALQISESNRPQVGGSWCGTSWGPSIYYSETNSVSIYVSLFRLSKDQSGYNFDFRMEYKFMKKKAATVRYGAGTPYVYVNTTVATSPTNAIDDNDDNDDDEEEEFYLGDLITGTYCSRIFSDCDRKRCRLQSPNFPGVYPRNLTCYYAIRQHELLPGKHALITVKQPKGQLISIRSQSALYGTASTRELKVWNDCDDVQDYVTVYDGYTTRDPVILKFCGSGEAVPEAVSSGHELLVEFSTSPYGTFLHPTPLQSLHGFQLEVEVKFVDQQAPVFVTSKRNCEFWIRGTTRGVLETPLHSLPANTTCLYHMQGIDTAVSPSPIPFRTLQPRYPDGYWRQSAIVYPPPRYRVWLSVIKFHVSAPIDAQKPDQEICRSYLNVWDGQLWSPTNCNGLFCSTKDKTKSASKTSISTSIGNRNVTLLARYCKEHIPRTCDHSMLANETRFPRPCSLSESFLSSGDSITLELRMADATALRPVKFRALYEFVDLHLDGEPYGEGPCSRKFPSQQDGPKKFQAPKDIFLYGRGGAKNISCVYRFEAQKGEKVKITLTKLIIKNRECRTKISPDTDRYQCYGNTTATIRFFDIPWTDVPGVPRDCLCSHDAQVSQPFEYISTSNIVELRFDVINMNASDDYTTLFFEGSWKFVRMPECKLNMRRAGPSGEIVLHHPKESAEEINCESFPRAMIPTANKYLYVKVNGIILKQLNKQGNETTVSQIKCQTSNRITIHTPMYSAIVCPYESSSRHHNLVEVFSEGWTASEDRPLPVDKVGIDHLGRELSRTIMVEFLGKESATYSVTWLELSRRRKEIPPNGMGLIIMMHDDCEHRCPELDACINTTVWCDGREDCPSGIDEALTHCSILLQLPPIYLFILVVVFLASCCIACLLVWRMCRRRPRSILQTRLKSLSSDTAIVDEKGVIC